jgi:hypothetical protein
MRSTVSTDSTSAVETPSTLQDSFATGFLPDDPHYRLTGEFLDKKTEKKDPPAADEQDPAAAVQNGDKDEKDEKDKAGAAGAAADPSKAAASGSAQTQTPGRKENRWQKREREMRELREENARLKSGSVQTQPRSETQQASQPAAETTTAAGKAEPRPKIDDVDAKTGKPKFKNFAEYEEAKDAWNRKETLREFQDTQRSAQQSSEQQRQFEERKATLIKKFEAPRAKYADFDAVALSDKLTIPAGSVTELFIHDSDHAGEVMYYLGKHPEITQGFYRNYDPKTGKFESLITPQRQFRKLMEIEAEVTGGGSQPRGSNSSSSSARPVSQASAPPNQVDGKGTVAKDAVEEAVKEQDFETYAKAQNARDLAKFKRK